VLTPWLKLKASELQRFFLSSCKTLQPNAECLIYKVAAGNVSCSVQAKQEEEQLKVQEEVKRRQEAIRKKEEEAAQRRYLYIMHHFCHELGLLH